jgi:transcriptional regulator with XRE-family HTH domain
MAGRRLRIGEIPRAQAEVVGANIRVLRQRNGWTQAELGALMGWQSNSTVCAAEGRRGGRQRGFTPDEVQRLASDVGRDSQAKGCSAGSAFDRSGSVDGELEPWSFNQESLPRATLPY